MGGGLGRAAARGGGCAVGVVIRRERGGGGGGRRGVQRWAGGGGGSVAGSRDGSGRLQWGGCWGGQQLEGRAVRWAVRRRCWSCWCWSCWCCCGCGRRCERVMLVL